MLLHARPHHNGVFSGFVITDFVKQHTIIIIIFDTCNQYLLYWQTSSLINRYDE